MSTLSNVKISASLEGSLISGAAPAKQTAAIRHAINLILKSGSTAGKVDKIYAATFSIAANGTPTVLDVTSLTDPAGGSVNMAHVCGIIVTNDSTNSAQIITLGGGTNPLFAGAVPIQPVAADGSGGFLILGAPNPGLATSGTVKNIQLVTASGTNNPGKITIIGRSA